MEKKLRQSNFELLRIIGMVLIVMSHCDELFGLAELYSTATGVNKLITDWLHIGGQIGVGCFLLISGYFMVEQTVSARKLLKLTGEVWAYTVGIWLCWTIAEACRGGLDFGSCMTEAVYAFFPVLSGHYWFVTAYVILLVLSPFFNKLIFALNQREYRKLLACLLLIFVLLQGGFPHVLPDMSEGRLIPVFILYFLAGYLKRFRTGRKGNANRHFAVAVLGYLLLFASAYGITFLGNYLRSEAIVSYRYFYRPLNSPFVVVICVELFIGFMETDMNYHKLINEIAGCTFGVYLIHQNRLMRLALCKWFPIYRQTRSLSILVYSLLSVLAIFGACAAVDYVRKRTLEKGWMRLLDRYLGRVQSRLLITADRISALAKELGGRYYKTR